MLDKSPENGDLEEELERIIMLADSITEKALSAAAEDLAGKGGPKRRKGDKNVKRSATTSLVLRRSCKSLQSGHTNKSSMLLHRRARLSPLAARAALAAAVTPLRQASETNPCQKSQRLNSHATNCKGNTNHNRIATEKVNRNGPNTRDQRMTSPCKQILGSPVKETASWLLSQCDEDVQLIVDIPIDKDLLVERTPNLTTNLSVFGR